MEGTSCLLSHGWLALPRACRTSRALSAVRPPSSERDMRLGQYQLALGLLLGTFVGSLVQELPVGLRLFLAAVLGVAFLLVAVARCFAEAETRGAEPRC